MELQRGIRIALELAALAAVVVRVPDNATRIEPLDEHDARRGTTVGADGGQRHRVGLGQVRIECLLQPQRELLQRVAVRGALVELGTFVTFA